MHRLWSAFLFFFSSRRRHTRCYRDWSSDVCSSDLGVSASATATLTVTSAPPVLTIHHTGNTIQISWPVSATGFVLQSTESLSPPAWAQPVESVSIQGDQNTVTITNPEKTRFYRLKLELGCLTAAGHDLPSPAQPKPTGARTSVRITPRTADVNEPIRHRGTSRRGSGLNSALRSGRSGLWSADSCVRAFLAPDQVRADKAVRICLACWPR